MALEWGRWEEEEEMVAWEGLWIKEKRVWAAVLVEGVRVCVVVCWLQLMPQAVLLVAGEIRWW